MKRHKLISSLVLGVMLAGQISFAGAVAMADSNDPSASPSPTPAVSDSPSPTPDPTPSPSPSVDPSPTPAPSSSPAPSASSSPAPSASSSPSSSPQSGADPAKTGVDPAQTGASGCQGVMPSWVFDTTIKKWVAADQGTFSCDPSGYWLSPKYYYNKRTGWYEILSPEAAASLPSKEWITAPNVIHTQIGDLVVGSQDYQIAKSIGLLDGPNSIVVSGTGAGSTNQAAVNNSNQSWIDLTNLVNVINTLQSNATSGNVSADKNTQVGSAVTGAASVISNLVNLLASAWSWSNGNMSFFMQNFFNLNKDLTLNPTESTTGGGGQMGGSATTSNTGPDSTNVAGVNNSSTLDVNAKNTGNIVNNVDLNAQSGNASATSNTQAGDVASGNALAEVNIINLINSFINSGSSFFGIINLFGTTNGDILFPNGFLNGLVASGAGNGSNTAGLSNTGAGSTNQAGVNNNAQTTVNNTSLGTINNNIGTTAASGSASADSNTVAGDLSTGGSSTTQGLFNIANSSIFGDNAVLVIVNVLGHWVGKIMDLPGGTTESALLTGNATVGSNNTGPDSTNQTNVNNNSTANINQSSVGTITNNVNVNAQSGDATASKNTEVGNVSTGDAKAASSVANIFNSVLNVKHWFGVLVINVFGDWLGDVNDNTAAGNSVQDGQGSNNAPAPLSGIAGSMPKVGLLGLVSGGGNGGSGTWTNAGTSTDAASVGSGGSQVLTAAASQPATTATKVASEVASSKDMGLALGLSAVGLLLAGAMISIDRKLKRR